VLSAIWSVEDREPVDRDHPCIALAKSIETLLGRCSAAE
jgi:hypothetical protein